MTPVIRLYWAIAVILMPLSFLWLHSSIGGSYSIQALTSSPFQLISLSGTASMGLTRRL